MEYEEDNSENSDIQDNLETDIDFKISYLFDDKYVDHIIDLNDMINYICREKFMPLYQNGSVNKLYNLIIDEHPDVINELIKTEELEEIQNESDEDNEDFYDFRNKNKTKVNEDE